MKSDKELMEWWDKHHPAKLSKKEVEEETRRANEQLAKMLEKREAK